MRMRAILLVLVALIASSGHAAEEVPAVGEKLTLSDAEWKKRLTAEQYQVLRQQGTERPFCGGYVQTKEHGPGTYHCSGCAAPLFEAGTKFESGTGWPSFFRALPDRVAEREDRSHGVVRTEVTCARCDGHLGHVFDDGPRPTGRRFCINAVSLSFTAAETPAKAEQAEQQK